MPRRRNDEFLRLGFLEGPRFSIEKPLANRNAAAYRIEPLRDGTVAISRRLSFAMVVLHRPLYMIWPVQWAIFFAAGFHPVGGGLMDLSSSMNHMVFLAFLLAQ